MPVTMLREKLPNTVTESQGVSHCYFHLVDVCFVTPGEVQVIVRHIVSIMINRRYYWAVCL